MSPFLTIFNLLSLIFLPNSKFVHPERQSLFTLSFICYLWLTIFNVSCPILISLYGQPVPFLLSLIYYLQYFCPILIKLYVQPVPSFVFLSLLSLICNLSFTNFNSLPLIFIPSPEHWQPSQITTQHQSRVVVECWGARRGQFPGWRGSTHNYLSICLLLLLYMNGSSSRDKRKSEFPLFESGILWQLNKLSEGVKVIRFVHFPRYLSAKLSNGSLIFLFLYPYNFFYYYYFYIFLSDFHIYNFFISFILYFSISDFFLLFFLYNFFTLISLYLLFSSYFSISDFLVISLSFSYFYFQFFFLCFISIFTISLFLSYFSISDFSYFYISIFFIYFYISDSFISQFLFSSHFSISYFLISLISIFLTLYFLLLFYFLFLYISLISISPTSLFLLFLYFQSISPPARQKGNGNT